MKIEEQLKQIGLDQAALKYSQISRRAVRDKWSYEEFVCNLIEEEIRWRKRRKETLYLQLAKFPTIKTFEGFDFSFNLSLEKRAIEELKKMRFVQRRENIILLGPPGVGKTHIAISLGIEAVKEGYLTYFTTVDEIVRKLKTTKDESFLKRLKKYIKPQLLIIDEMGYIPLQKEEANLLFQLVNDRYEKGSIIITSNKSIVEWGEYLGDDVLAGAILDRLLHHSYVINIKGNSYRLKDKLISRETKEEIEKEDLNEKFIPNVD